MKRKPSFPPLQYSLLSQNSQGKNSAIYTYATNQNKAAGVPGAVTDAKNVTKYQNYDFSSGRMTGQGIDGVADVSYTYTDRGQLGALSRIGFYNGESASQSYAFAYDSFGNVLSTSVGDRTLAAYTYAQKDGLLSRMTYGTGDYIDYAYDRLGRTTEKKIVSGNSTRTIDYAYNGDGQLYSVKDGSTVYGYTYDTLGRLVGTTQKNGTALAQQSWRQFDDNNRLTGLNISIRGIGSVLRESSTYNTQGIVTRQGMLSGEYIDLTYDSLSRLSRRDIAYALLEDFSYASGASANTTTALISEIQHKNKLNGAVLGSYQYTYDALGNISAVTRSGFGTTSYAYDTPNQLTSATTVSDSGTKQYSYTYDTFGNLRTASDGSATHTYTYGDADWKDLLTAYDGHAITYDAIGNPLTYHEGTSFVWKNGRQLASLTKSGATATYQYDSNGLRTRKSRSGAGYTEYFWQDGRLIAERVCPGAWSTTSEIHIFSYDESGAPIGIRIDGTDYYYGRNAQGDIEALYEWKVTPSGTESSELIATYEYDPWGKLLAVKDADGNAITSSACAAVKNPLRYRGYYYDAETGFYYLQSRYYDPEICRFINADSYASTGQGLLGYNAFAYCNNNPVNMADTTGALPFFLVTAAIGAVAGAIVGGVIAAKNGGNVWAGIGIGAAAGALIGTGAGMTAGAMLAGSATASIAAVASGTGMLLTAVSTGGVGAGVALVVDNISRAVNNVGTVLYSGGELARTVASTFAKNTGGTTIDATVIGQVADAASKAPGADFVTVWSQASAAFCSQASGVVNAFVASSAYRGVESIFWSVEMPTLLNNPNVTEIIIHIFE